ncbi:DUF1444 family protein [Flavobacterium sp. W21_SRS_FM6]|uniref:DUF1444 family protein n=1 Tax=Flavobacterium sp. W21_SRS_FM6 TaxID=3240268 RepID=UPI003F93B0A5
MRYFPSSVLLILCLFSCFAPLFAQESVVSPEAFRQTFIATLAEKIPGVKTEIKGEMEVHILEPEEFAFINYLDNVYIRYQNNPQDLAILMEEYIDSILAMNQQKASKMVLEDLVPILKDMAYIETIKQVMGSKTNKKGQSNPTLFYEPINSELVMLFAFDSPSSLRFASVDDLAEFNLDTKALKQVAIENLFNRLPDIHIQGNDDIKYLVAGGMFESSLLLVDAMWNKDNFPFEGNLLVFVPTRDVVLITGSKNQAGIAQARKIIMENQFAHMVSEHAFEFVDGQWRLFIE